MKRYKIFDSISKAEATIDEAKSVKVIIGQVTICLSRYKGKFYAHEHNCPHQFESLAKGTINYLGEIICPLHSYRYDLKTGRECQMKTRDMITYPVEIDNEGLFVQLAN